MRGEEGAQETACSGAQVPLGPRLDRVSPRIASRVEGGRRVLQERTLLLQVGSGVRPGPRTAVRTPPGRRPALTALLALLWYIPGAQTPRERPVCTPCTQPSLPHQPLRLRDCAALLRPARLRALVRVAAPRLGHRVLCRLPQPFCVRRDPEGNRSSGVQRDSEAGACSGDVAHWLRRLRRSPVCPPRAGGPGKPGCHSQSRLEGLRARAQR